MAHHHRLADSAHSYQQDKPGFLRESLQCYIFDENLIRDLTAAAKMRQSWLRTDFVADEEFIEGSFL